MDLIKCICDAYKSDVPLLIKGYSGWGKSEMVAQAAEKCNVKLIDKRLAGMLPEDFAIPNKNKDCFSMLPPKWVKEIKNSNGQFWLFLDEINQAPGVVLNAVYSIVLDRRVGDVDLKGRMWVVAAANYDEESGYLNELPDPLKNRFAIIDMERNKTAAITYLSNKYADNEKAKAVLNYFTDECNPRAIEDVMRMVNADVVDEHLFRRGLSAGDSQKLIKILSKKKVVSRHVDSIDQKIKKVVNAIKEEKVAKLDEDIFEDITIENCQRLFKLTDEEFESVKMLVE